MKTLRIILYVFMHVVLLPIDLLAMLLWFILGLIYTFSCKESWREYYRDTVTDNEVVIVVRNWIETGKHKTEL